MKEGTQTLETYDYFVRADGLRDHVVETDQNGIATRITWTYDALGRLVSETRDEGNDSVQNGGDYTDTYTLDMVGNQVQKVHDAVGTANDETIIKTYNSRDQLLSEDSTNNANDATYAYDGNGSQTLKSSSAGDTIYKWDLHNRMVAIDSNNDGTPETVYGYDSNGVRVGERTSTGTRLFLNDPQNPTGYTKAVEEKLDANSDGTPESVDRSYIIGQQVIAQADNSHIYYLVVDGHGSTRAILNAGTGTLDQKYGYNAYGDLLNTSLTPLTNWLFGGGSLRGT